MKKNKLYACQRAIFERIEKALKKTEYQKKYKKKSNIKSMTINGKRIYWTDQRRSLCQK
jgi:hypothetical protein